MSAPIRNHIIRIGSAWVLKACTGSGPSTRPVLTECRAVAKTYTAGSARNFVTRLIGRGVAAQMEAL